MPFFTRGFQYIIRFLFFLRSKGIPFLLFPARQKNNKIWWWQRGLDLWWDWDTRWHAILSVFKYSSADPGLENWSHRRDRRNIRRNIRVSMHVRTPITNIVTFFFSENHLRLLFDAVSSCRNVTTTTKGFDYYLLHCPDRFARFLIFEQIIIINRPLLLLDRTHCD